MELLYEIGKDLLHLLPLQCKPLEQMLAQTLLTIPEEAVKMRGCGIDFEE